MMFKDVFNIYMNAYMYTCVYMFVCAPDKYDLLVQLQRHLHTPPVTAKAINILLVIPEFIFLPVHVKLRSI